MCVFTGQRICRLEENCEVGNGTYSRNGYVYSSIAGYLQTSGGEDGKVVLSSHNYMHPMFQLIQFLTGFEDNKSFVWPENGSVARSRRPEDNKSVQRSTKLLLSEKPVYNCFVIHLHFFKKLYSLFPLT